LNLQPPTSNLEPRTLVVTVIVTVRTSNIEHRTLNLLAFNITHAINATNAINAINATNANDATNATNAINAKNQSLVTCHKSPITR